MMTNRAVTETKRANDGEVMPVTDQDEAEIKLNSRQKMFVEAYFATSFNAGEAAIKAGYSHKSARQVASRLLTNANVARAIEKRLTTKLADEQMRGDEVLSLLAQHARGNMEDYIDPDSLAVDFKKAKLAKKLHLVKKFKCTTMINAEKDIQVDTIEFELYDAQAALSLLGKHLSLFNDKLNVTIDVKQLSDDELMKLAEGKKP
jgi:phage terminase small subunit